MATSLFTPNTGGFFFPRPSLLLQDILIAGRRPAVGMHTHTVPTLVLVSNRLETASGEAVLGCQPS